MAIKRSDGQAKNPHAQAMAALGASKGGKARAAVLSRDRLSEIGRAGAKARTEKYGDRWGAVLKARRNNIATSSEE